MKRLGLAFDRWPLSCTWAAGGPQQPGSVPQPHKGAEAVPHLPTSRPFCEELRVFGAAVARGGGAVGATGHGTHALPPSAPAGPKRLAADEEDSWRGRIFRGNLDSAARDTASAMVQALAEQLKPEDGASSPEPEEARRNGPAAAPTNANGDGAPR